jgi:hypothetical protein
MAKGLIFGALAWSLVCGQARAFELAGGVMFGGTATHVSGGLGNGANGAALNQWAGNPSFGLILEQRFDVHDVLLEICEDFQPIPVLVQTGSASNSAGYLPVDLGVRLGLATSALQPYFSVLLQGLFLTGHPGHPGAGAPLKQAAFGVGGAFGADLAVFFLRFGVEARLTETVTDLSPSGSVPDPGNAAVFQLFLSLRSAF